MRISDAERIAELHAEIERLIAINDRYREALLKIAGAQSGQWGWDAHNALHPREDERAPP